MLDDFMNFAFDCFYDIRSKSSLLLLNQLGIWFNVKIMHGHLRIEARHVFIAPVKTSIYFYMRDMRFCFSVGDKLSLIEMSFEYALSPTSTWITLSKVGGLRCSKCFSH